MLPMVDERRFMQELPGWLLRGGACALPSAWFAIAVIPPGLAMLAAILTGFALVVAAFAAVCSGLDPDGPPWGRALRIAAWIRAALSVGPGLYLDVITGGFCAGLLRVEGARDAVGQFALVLATTLAQGAFVALEVFLLATMLLLSGLVRR
jgi:hypothetical protein